MARSTAWAPPAAGRPSTRLPGGVSFAELHTSELHGSSLVAVAQSSLRPTAPHTPPVHQDRQQSCGQVHQSVTELWLSVPGAKYWSRTTTASRGRRSPAERRRHCSQLSLGRIGA